MRIDMPLCFGASASVRHASQMKSARLAPLVNTLLPLTTYWSPSRTARVRSDAKSVPASGSVYPMAKFNSPCRIPGRNRCFCSSVPMLMSVGPTVFTVTNGKGAPPRPVPLVTGPSRGIGKAAAVDLAAAGFDVAVAARTAVDGTAHADAHAIPGGLDTTVAQIEQQGVHGLALVMDLLDRHAVLSALDAALEQFGRIDVLVNNGIYQGSAVPPSFDEFEQ